jgi:hypothetical protein
MKVEEICGVFPGSVVREGIDEGMSFAFCRLGHVALLA